MSTNNQRCFVFAIGGTGSRVLRSLTHLLAAGVKPDNDFDIIPIIIDPHYGNEDLQRTARLLDYYKKVRKFSDPNGFFPTKIYTLEDMKAAEPDKFDEKTVFTFNLRGSGDKFRDYIGHSTMRPENAALVELLFSGRSKDKRGEDCQLLDIQMDIGFVGNPNVGSVVLNQIADSDIFSSFTTGFNPNDRIFIISSIFGGTGAAGFPCLLKNIREGRGKGSDDLKKAKIGAVSILPYFKLEEKEGSAIDYSDFIAKTKSALYYYDKNVTGNNSVNVMYYIGDNPNKIYDNDPGYGGQKNKAHFVELAGALAIMNFLSIPNNDSRLECEVTEPAKVGKATKPTCIEFSIRRDASTPDLYDFRTETQGRVAMPLAQFALFRKYMDEEYKNKTNAWKKEPPKLDDGLLTDAFYRDNLKEFFKDFYEWLTELNENNRGFAPFNLTRGSELKSFINGMEFEEKGVIFKKKIPTYADFEECLNAHSKNKSFETQEKKLMDVFYLATKKLLNDVYELNRKLEGVKK